MPKVHDLGNDYVAQLNDDGGMYVSNAADGYEVVLKPSSVARLRSIFQQAEQDARFTGIQARDTAVEVCGPQTGHTVRPVAFCDTPETAELLAAAAKTVYGGKD